MTKEEAQEIRKIVGDAWHNPPCHMLYNGPIAEPCGVCAVCVLEGDK